MDKKSNSFKIYAFCLTLIMLCSSKKKMYVTLALL